MNPGSTQMLTTLKQSENDQVRSISREAVVSPSETTRGGRFCCCISLWIVDTVEKAFLQEILICGQLVMIPALCVAKQMRRIWREASATDATYENIETIQSMRSVPSLRNIGIMSLGSNRDRLTFATIFITVEIETLFFNVTITNVAFVDLRSSSLSIIKTEQDEAQEFTITTLITSKRFAALAMPGYTIQRGDGRSYTMHVEIVEDQTSGIVDTGFVLVVTGNTKSARYSPCLLATVRGTREKAVGGYASSAQTDSGVTLGMLGALLTWLQEHNSPILTMATCNDYAKLPAELTRAGRFDERFFVDLPSKSERESIAEIHLRHFGCENIKIDPIKHTSISLEIADLTEGFTGAEIEQLIRSVARRTERRITMDAVLETLPQIKPISRVRAEEISKLREWGKAQLRIANTPEAEKTGRKVRMA